MTFERCRFTLGPDVEASDTTYVAATRGGAAGDNNVVRVIGGTLDAAFDAMFAPICSRCERR